MHANADNYEINSFGINDSGYKITLNRMLNSGDEQGPKALVQENRQYPSRYSLKDLPAASATSLIQLWSKISSPKSRTARNIKFFKLSSATCFHMLRSLTYEIVLQVACDYWHLVLTSLFKAVAHNCISLEFGGGGFQKWLIEAAIFIVKGKFTGIKGTVPIMYPQGSCK